MARDDAENIMPATIAAARAGATTGEWSQTLRDVFGEYRAPTGVGEAAAVSSEDVAELRDEVERVSEALGRRLKFLVGKPGLDGHSNGAEQIAVRARDAGMDVVYEGIRLTPVADRQLRRPGGRPRDRALDPVGLARRADPVGAARRWPTPASATCPSSSAGSSPRPTPRRCARPGVAAVYTPKDWDLNRMMRDIIALVGEQLDDSGAAHSGEAGVRRAVARGIDRPRRLSAPPPAASSAPACGSAT